MNCTNCSKLLQDYFDASSGFTEYICWKCGYYESNSPAYRSNPNGFKNMVRENPSILRQIINRNFTSKKSTSEWTEPQNNTVIKY